jgi:NUMOD3 motif
MEKNHYVYLTTNRINGKQYIGDRTCNCVPEKDVYFGSGTLISNAVTKYKKENFTKQILEKFNTKQEAFDAQEKYIIEYNTLIPNGYNISPKGGYGIPDSYLHEETKKKIGKSQSGKKHSEKQNKDHSNTMKGENNPNWGGKSQKSSETIKKLKHPKSEEQKEKLRKALKGKKHSQERNKQKSLYMTGKKRGPYKKLRNVV